MMVLSKRLFISDEMAILIYLSGPRNYDNIEKWREFTENASVS